MVLLRFDAKRKSRAALATVYTVFQHLTGIADFCLITGDETVRALKFPTGF